MVAMAKNRTWEFMHHLDAGDRPEEVKALRAAISRKGANGFPDAIRGDCHVRCILSPFRTPVELNAMHEELGRLPTALKARAAAEFGALAGMGD